MAKRTHLSKITIELDWQLYNELFQIVRKNEYQSKYYIEIIAKYE